MKHWYLAVTLGAMMILLSPSARADFITTAVLNSATEVPPHVTLATGFAKVVFDSALDELLVTVDFLGLSAPASVAHIHFGGPTIRGPVILPLLSFPGATSGTYSAVLTAADLIPVAGINTFADAVNAIESGNTYVNIHDAFFPGGEIRGQFAVQTPEPSSVVLLGAVLLAYAAWRLRRRFAQA